MTSILNNSRRPDITFYADGRIDITARVAKMLSLQDNDVIDIVIDEREYLLYRKYKGENIVGRHEAQCHVSHRRASRSLNFRAYSKRLCSAMLQAAATDDIARLPVGMPVSLPVYGDAVPIIYRNNIKK